LYIADRRNCARLRRRISTSGVSVVSDYFLSDAETIALLAEQSPLAIP